MKPVDTLPINSTEPHAELHNNRVGTAHKNTLWYLVSIQQAASASSGAKESNSLKSNSLNNLPCLCLTVNLGVWGPWGSSPPSCNWTSSGGLGTVVLPLPWPLGFSFGGSVSKLCCSLPPQLPFYFLASTLCICFVQ